MVPSFFSTKTLTNTSIQSDVVHITFLSEAYTIEEEDVFYDDIDRLVADVILKSGAPFESLSPLLAIHAVFVPSELNTLPLLYLQQQLRGGGKTAFGLHREEGPLRTVAPVGDGSVAYSKARRICAAAAPGCDHIILVAQDHWYGGLGDSVAIITSSLSSGALALRHELGHILADIGEEYDGGSDYSGPNFSTSRRLCAPQEQPALHRTGDGTREVWPCVPWRAWLALDGTEGGAAGGAAGGGELANAAPAEMALAAWPFADLRAGPVVLPLSVRPNLPGTRVLLSVAGVGPGGTTAAAAEHAPTDTSARAGGSAGRVALVVTVGDLEVVLPDGPGLDRRFHTWAAPPLIPGQQLTVALRQLPLPPHDETPAQTASASDISTDPAAPPPMLCHLQVHQYHSAAAAERAARPGPATWDRAATPIGAYPVFGADGKRLGFRPTEDGCLMRRMEANCFCPVCLERLWRRVLSKAGLLRHLDSSSPVASPGSTNNGLAAAKYATADATNGRGSLTSGNGRGSSIASTMPPSRTPPLRLTVLPAAAGAAAAGFMVRVRPHPLGESGHSGDAMRQGESLDVVWTFDSGGAEAEVTALRGAEAAALPAPAAGDTACWRVRARLRTERVRTEPRVFEDGAFAFAFSVDLGGGGGAGFKLHSDAAYGGGYGGGGGGGPSEAGFRVVVSLAELESWMPALRAHPDRPRIQNLAKRCAVLHRAGAEAGEAAAPPSLRGLDGRGRPTATSAWLTSAEAGQPFAAAFPDHLRANVEALREAWAVAASGESSALPASPSPPWHNSTAAFSAFDTIRGRPRPGTDRATAAADLLVTARWFAEGAASGGFAWSGLALVAVIALVNLRRGGFDLPFTASGKLRRN